MGDYFILAPTHKAASVMAALNLTVFVYNYEYRSDFDQWEGEFFLLRQAFLKGVIYLCPYIQTGISFFFFFFSILFFL